MSFSSYKGYQIFDLFPMFSRDVSTELAQTTKEFGTIGHIHSYTYEDYPRFALKADYICNGAAEIKAVNDFFDSVKGRNGELWFPSWRKDLNIINGIAPTTTEIYISDYNYSAFYPLSHMVGNNIMIYVNRNRYYAREVTAKPSDVRIYIDTELGTNVRINEIKLCCFLYFGRLDLDQIEWTYITPYLAKFSLNFIELPKQTP